MKSLKIDFPIADTGFSLGSLSPKDVAELYHSARFEGRTVRTQAAFLLKVGLAVKDMEKPNKNRGTIDNKKTIENKKNKQDRIK